MSGARITIAGLTLPLTNRGPSAGTGDALAPTPHPANTGRNPMDHTTGQPAGPAQVSVGGFRVRAADPRPSRPPARPSPAPPRPDQQQPTPPPSPAPKAARPPLKLVSSTAKPRTQKPPSDTDDAHPWRYWVAVTFTDGHTGSTMELRRTAPIITSQDRQAVADAISAHLQRPVASVAFISPITRPNSVTGEPEPDIPANLRTSPVGDAQPWHYRVKFVTDTGGGTCDVDRTGPISSPADLAAVQAAIAEHNGRKVVAIESFSVLGAPAQTAPRGI